MAQLEKKLELEFTFLSFYHHYVISTPKEGVVLDQKQLGDLVEACSGHYPDRNFVFLINRSNNYNVNPVIYLDVEQVENLIGIGVVTNKKSFVDMANFEKNFSKIPYEVFPDMDSALEWTNRIITQKDKKADL